MRNVVILATIMLAIGCAGVQHPKWTNLQCDVEDGVVHAVGQSNFQNPIMRRDSAQLQARGSLGQCLAAMGTRDARRVAGGASIVDMFVDEATGIEYARAAAPAATTRAAAAGTFSDLSNEEAQYESEP